MDISIVVGTIAVTAITMSMTTKFQVVNAQTTIIVHVPLPVGANSQPNVIPGKNGMNTVIVSNGRSYYPTLIGSSGNVKISDPNGNFTITGNEQYVNSGWLLPKGLQQMYPGSSHTFTVTFQKAGIYTYL